MEQIDVTRTDFPEELIAQEAARRRLRNAEQNKRTADTEHEEAIQEWNRACGAVLEWQSEHRPENERPQVEAIRGVDYGLRSY